MIVSKRILLFLLMNFVITTGFAQGNYSASDFDISAFEKNSSITESSFDDISFDDEEELGMIGSLKKNKLVVASVAVAGFFGYCMYNKSLWERITDTFAQTQEFGSDFWKALRGKNDPVKVDDSLTPPSRPDNSKNNSVTDKDKTSFVQNENIIHVKNEDRSKAVVDMSKILINVQNEFKDARAKILAIQSDFSTLNFHDLEADLSANFADKIKLLVDCVNAKNLTYNFIDKEMSIVKAVNLKSKLPKLLRDIESQRITQSQAVLELKSYKEKIEKIAQDVENQYKSLFLKTEREWYVLWTSRGEKVVAGTIVTIVAIVYGVLKQMGKITFN